jgi:hypothetical protein
VRAFGELGQDLGADAADGGLTWDCARIDGVLIDLSPLLSGARGDAVLVAGVRVGEAARNIDRDVVTDSQQGEPGELRPTDRDAFHVGPYRSAVERSVRERRKRFEATLSRGGFIRCDEITLSVKDSLIARIIVRGPSLASLGLAREEDIADRFGAAAGQEVESGRRLHHYPARDLAIAWDLREDRIEYVVLGNRWGEPQLGAENLLAEILHAFNILERTNWAEPPDGSARIRYRRIAALSRALGLGAVTDVVNGTFLKGDLDAKRCALLKEIAARRALRSTRTATHWHAARIVFERLLAYRNDVRRVVHATSGWLLCSNHVLLGMIATQNQLGRQIEALMVDVDRWLCTLMDPDRRMFGLRDLIVHHGWPDVDDRTLVEMEMGEF